MILMRSLCGFLLFACLLPAQTVDLGALTAAERDTARSPLRRGQYSATRTGVHRSLGQMKFTAGTRLRSTGAYGIRVHFEGFDAADGAVVLRSTQGETARYTGRGPLGDGEFWSQTLFDEEIQLDFEPGPSGAKASWHVPEISHSFGPRGYAAVETDQLRCDLDVNCHAEYGEWAKSVAMIAIETPEGQGTCSGALVRTKSGSGVPYFLTAFHCVGNEQEARTVESFWNYQTDKCNGKAPDPKNAIRPRPTGAQYVSGLDLNSGDAALIVLNAIPPEARFAEFDPRPLALGEAIVGISHPHGSHKRIVFGELFQSYWVYNNFPSSQYYYTRYTKGAAHPGSSGSPLFTSKGAIAGMLSHGSNFDDINVDVCAQDPKVVGYAKLSLAWPKFQAYLDDPAPSTLSFSPSAVSLTLRNGKLTGDLRQTVVISTTSDEPVAIGVNAPDLWVRVLTPRGTAVKGAPFTTQIEIRPELLAQRTGLVQTRLEISSGNNGRALPVDADVVVVPSSVQFAPQIAATPEGDCRYTLRLDLSETAGVDTALTALRINGEDYSGQIGRWFGTTQLTANGKASTALKICGPVDVNAPYEFILAGRDAGSGRAWSVQRLAELPR